jgi:hypothetical protein
MTAIERLYAAVLLRRLEASIRVSKYFAKG